MVMERLNEPYTGPSEEGEAASKSGITPTSSAPTVPQRTLMFVESNVALQDIIRARLKNNGYRVLVMADPDRALARFADGSKAADCVIFSTGELGERSFEAFNRFADGEHTREIPAVLLLGENQGDWKSKAKLNDHRVVVSMPIKLRQVRELLARLVPLVEGPAETK
jgi:serine/threonine-protein kinase